MSVPNQKKIIIQNVPCDRNNLYCMINIEAFQKAVSELSGVGLALWCYLAKNQNGYSLDLSPADAAKWGIKRSSFYRAEDELTRLGYIKYHKGNVFIFCNNPNPKMELIESQNETQKTQVPKWDSNLMGSPKMRHTKSQNETWQSQNETQLSQNEYRNITYITDNTKHAATAATTTCNITGTDSTVVAAVTSPQREEFEEPLIF